MKINFKTGAAVFLAIVVALGSAYIASPAASQARGEASLNKFLKVSGIVSPMHTCTPDTDGDGYASCTYETKDDMQAVQCTSDLISVVPLFGSQSCKAQTQEVLKLK